VRTGLSFESYVRRILSCVFTEQYLVQDGLLDQENEDLLSGWKDSGFRKDIPLELDVRCTSRRIYQ
jgi:hypothetical protein